MQHKFLAGYWKKGKIGGVTIPVDKMAKRGVGIEQTGAGWRHASGNNYILAIGINAYEDWPPLYNAVKDVKDILEILVRQYQFEEDKVVTLFDEQATERKIYDKIRELKQSITPQDNLVILFSGHGHYDPDFKEGFWIPVDACRDSEATYISNANIIRLINAIDSHHTFLIVDSCFSGTLLTHKRAAAAQEQFRSRRVLASGRAETVDDGAPGQNSPFARAIITYLKKNTEKAVEATSVIQYVKEDVGGRARQAPIDGRLQNADDEGGEFIFHLKMNEQDMWARVKADGGVEAYENYLDYFPSGRYSRQARLQILQLREEDVWRSALNKDNEVSYQEYIREYSPNGKYLDEAKRRLLQIGEEAKRRRLILEELAGQEEQRENIRRQYQSLVREAEALFASRQLDEARRKYRECLQHHMDGFVPAADYLQGQINFCSNGIRFLEHYENGKQAMDGGNYSLALQYFSEARKLDNNPKMDDLVRVCRQRLEGKSRGGETAEPVALGAPAPQKTPVAVKKKKGNFLGGCLLGGIATVALIVYILFEIGRAQGTPSEPTLWPAEQLIGVWRAAGDGTYNGITNEEASAYAYAEYTFSDGQTLYIVGNRINETYHFHAQSRVSDIILQSARNGPPIYARIRYLDQQQLSLVLQFPAPNGGFRGDVAMDLRRVE